MYSQFIDEISAKYAYDDELKIAIEKTIPLMIERYGEENKEEVFSLFRNLKIFSCEDINKETLDSIRGQVMGDNNKHVIEIETESAYGSGAEASSAYSYETLYDENMDILGEFRWLVVKDMKGSVHADLYKEKFGTTINMPYFIHEINHAYAMQHPKYVIDGNKIYSKHGMYETVDEFERKGNTVELRSVNKSHVILEEMINESISQEMLVELLNVKDYDEVKEIYEEIHHVSTGYTSSVIFLAQQLEQALGRDNLDKYRMNNVSSIIKDFNITASQSSISDIYFKDQTAYDYLSEKCFEIFSLSQTGFMYSPDEYGAKMRELLWDGIATIDAYKGVSLDDYEQIRSEALGTVEEKKQL